MTYDYSQSERISQYACEKLHEAIQDPENKASTLPYEDRLANYDQFQRRKQGSFSVSYSELPVLLEATGFSYADFFAMIGVPLVWPDKDTVSMAGKLERLRDDPDVLALFYRHSQAMLPEVWSTDVWGWTPSYRMHMYRMHVVDPQKRVKIRSEYKAVYPRFFAKTGTNARSRVNTEDIPMLAGLYGIPLHWLLCAPRDTVVLTSSPMIEALMDDYMRLTEMPKRILETMVDDVLENKRRIC